MKITKAGLLDTDKNTLFTRDPSAFFESVLINVLWGKDGATIDQEVIERQKLVFAKWHEYFAANLRTDIEKELTPQVLRANARGHLAGRIYALQNLPLKKTLVGQSIDIEAVTALLRQLKAQEPIGVTNNAQGTTN